MPRPKPSTRPEARPRPSVDWALVERILGLSQVRTVYLYGPPGVGKTYVAYRSGRVENGVWSITLTEDTPASELRGHWLPRGREMVWHDGPFTAAMRAGARLVVNEVTHASPDVHSLLHPVLESLETAQLTLPTHETVRPAPGFHVVCTDNAPPQSLPPALCDRFDCVLPISGPHPAALARLSEPLRQAAERCLALEEERRIGLRAWLAIEALRAELGLESACLAVLGPERGAQVWDGLALAERASWWEGSR
jgi:MoxR-like ATPase